MRSENSRNTGPESNQVLPNKQARLLNCSGGSASLPPRPGGLAPPSGAGGGGAQRNGGRRSGGAGRRGGRPAGSPAPPPGALDAGDSRARRHRGSLASRGPGGHGRGERPAGAAGEWGLVPGRGGEEGV